MTLVSVISINMNEEQTVFPCCAEILFQVPCIKDGIVDTKRKGECWGTRPSLSGKQCHYHYLCSTKTTTEVIYLTNHDKKKLGNYLLNIWSTGDKEHWIESVLHACGYRPKEEK